MATITVVKGSLVKWIEGPSGSVGVVIEILADGERLRIRFDSGEELTFVWPTDVLEKLIFDPGSSVKVQLNGQVGVVTSSSSTAGLMLYQVSLPDGSQPTIVESGLRPAVITDPLELFRRGQVQNVYSTNLQLTGTRLLFEHRYNELSSLSNSRIEIKPHQVGVVHGVASNYPHRALLADEVGLGKTIEAGLIIKELKARGVANRVLILAPSGIVSQWQLEMRSKFGLIFSQYRRDSVGYLEDNHPGENVWTLNSNIITSTSYASLDENRRREIGLAGWDLVVIDEAHHARRTWQGQSKYTETTLYKLAAMLADPEVGNPTGFLLLTATPMQLHRFELYSLIELLDPALFPSFADFNHHCDSLSGLNHAAEAVRRWSEFSESDQELAKSEICSWLAYSPEEIEVLLDDVEGRKKVTEELHRQHRLGEVLIRNRKAIVGGFMPRVAFVWPVEMTPQEREAYDAVTGYVRSGYARSKSTQNNALGFLMTIFQKLNTSSSFALRQSLLRRIEKLEAGISQDGAVLDLEDEELEEQPIGDALGEWLGARYESDVMEEVGELARIVQLLDSIPIDSKARVLNERLADILVEEPNAKVIIFTQFRETQDYLSKVIDSTWNLEAFHGSLKPSEKDKTVSRFRQHPGPTLMISTEAGGEGRNFQFCHILINYDLPWNPMKVEQRIGRVDRLGQKHAVKVINFSILGTIEERVLDVLSRRIRVFEETIGGLDPILGDVSSSLRDIFLSAERESEEALRRFDEDLEVRINAARDTETRLADFIMDTKSFRQDEVQALLKNKSALDSKTMERFVLVALSELGVKITDDPELESVIKLRLGGQFYAEFPQFAKDESSRQITFDPSVALDYETLEFLAFGHELVEALIERVRAKEYLGRASYRLIRTNKQPETRGWCFTYILGFGGIIPRKEMFSVFVDVDGEADEDLGTWLLERACRLKREDWDGREFPSIDDRFEQAAQNAEGRAVQRMLERQVELASTNGERLAQERLKLERYYEYREEGGIEKIESVRATLERISTSTDPDVQRIIPVWAKNLENAKRVLEKLLEERDRRLKDLSEREQVTAQHEIYSASFVEIIPKPDQNTA